MINQLVIKASCKINFEFTSERISPILDINFIHPSSLESNLHQADTPGFCSIANIRSTTSVKNACFQTDTPSCLLHYNRKRKNNNNNNNIKKKNTTWRIFEGIAYQLCFLYPLSIIKHSKKGVSFVQVVVYLFRVLYLQASPHDLYPLTASFKIVLMGHLAGDYLNINNTSLLFS